MTMASNRHLTTSPSLPPDGPVPDPFPPTQAFLVSAVGPLLPDGWEQVPAPPALQWWCSLLSLLPGISLKIMSRSPCLPWPSPGLQDGDEKQDGGVQQASAASAPGSRWFNFISLCCLLPAWPYSCHHTHHLQSDGWTPWWLGDHSPPAHLSW